MVHKLSFLLPSTPLLEVRGAGKKKVKLFLEEKTSHKINCLKDGTV